jgi:hypothetical protein
MLAASQNQVARIIVQTTQGHSPKPAKGMLMAVEQAGLPLMTISARRTAETLKETTPWWLAL